VARAKKKSVESSAPTTASTLDEALPKFTPKTAETYTGLSLIKVADSLQLLELATSAKLRKYLLARLDDQTAIIIPGQDEAFAKAMATAGMKPKIVRGMRS
jgi:hypothetical protein